MSKQTQTAKYQGQEFNWHILRLLQRFIDKCQRRVQIAYDNGKVALRIVEKWIAVVVVVCVQRQACQTIWQVAYQNGKRFILSFVLSNHQTRLLEQFQKRMGFDELCQEIKCQVPLLVHMVSCQRHIRRRNKPKERQIIYFCQQVTFCQLWRPKVLWVCPHSCNLRWEQFWSISFWTSITD